MPLWSAQLERLHRKNHRIIQSENGLGLERILKLISAQHPAMGRSAFH